MTRGVTHADTSRRMPMDDFYFLEIAARVGGAFISGPGERVDGHQSLARVGAARSLRAARRELSLPQTSEDYAGSVLCPGQYGGAGYFRLRRTGDRLSHEETSPCGADRAFRRSGTVRELLEKYADEFAWQFLAAMPPPEKPTAVSGLANAAVFYSVVTRDSDGLPACLEEC